MGAAASAVASAWLFDRIVRDRWGDGAWGGLWFASLGAVALLANGWLVFALGLAFSLAALRALQTGRRASAAALAIASALASPVAAAFLALVVRGRGAPAGAGGRCGALVPLALLGLLFPESGAFPFWFSAWWPFALFCVLAFLATRGIERERDVRVGILVYLVLATLAAVTSNPLGGNMTRLGALFGGPLLLAVLLARPRAPAHPGGGRRARRRARLAGDHPARRTSESLGDPATERSYYAPLVAWLGARRPARAHRGPAHVQPLGDGVRLAALLARTGMAAPTRPRAQRDLLRGGLTNTRYRRWLIEKGIRWVAASDARLDYSAQDEDRLVREDPPYLRLRGRLEHWRIYEVAGAILSGGPAARASALGPESFVLDVEPAGPLRRAGAHQPYWDGDRASAWVRRATGRWCGCLRRERSGRIRAAAAARAASGTALLST